MPWDIWLIFLVLGAVLPWRGRARMKELLAMPRVSTMERLSLYASTIAFQCLAVAALLHVGLPAWAVVLLSSVLFGLAHSYQGRGGIVMTLLIGLILGTSRLAYGSLVPAIFWHSGVDVVAGTAGPRYLTPRGASSQKRKNVIH